MKIKRGMETKVSELHHDQAQLLTSHDDFYVREAYKSLRTNVMFSLTDDKKSHVVMVTSAMPSEGKSTTAINLAISLAEAGKKTLIVDCDMRKPKIGRLMNVKTRDGLSDVLFQRDKCEKALIQVKDMELCILTAGSIPPNPSELLGSGRMQRLIESMRERFDYIILDMPPINVVTDAVIASPLADGALMVVRSEMSERNDVLRAMDQLERANTKILGAVLTCVKEEKHAYGNYRKQYKYGYKHGYGYGYGYLHFLLNEEKAQQHRSNNQQHMFTAALEFLQIATLQDSSITFIKERNAAIHDQQ